MGSIYSQSSRIKTLKNNHNNYIEIVSPLAVDFICLCGSCPEIFGFLRSSNPEPLGWWVKPATDLKRHYLTTWDTQIISL